MKNLITILLLSILTITVNAQTSLETAVLKELNTYRAKNHLCTLKIDNALSTWSSYHARYLAKLNTMGKVDRSHDEKIDISDWKELSFEQRAIEFNKADDNNHINGEVQTRSIPFEPGTPEKDIAKRIIDGFDNSPLHKEIINSEYDTASDLPIVGISVIKNQDQIGGYDVYTVVIDLGVKFDYVKK